MQKFIHSRVQEFKDIQNNEGPTCIVNPLVPALQDNLLYHKGSKYCTHYRLGVLWVKKEKVIVR